MSDITASRDEIISSRTLPQWLDYLESIHPKNIEMGLDRVATVFAALDVSFADTRVVTVAGTNGKGTTCAVIEQGCLIAGNSVAVYSSPHLLDYRERVRINGQMLSEKSHCQAFVRVERARGDISLTFFEFATLAAFCLIEDANVDVALLEVGLGGRLDAVNIVDPDLAVITGIDIDHKDWLGDTREQIGFEKAGIMRTGIPAVIGDPLPPVTIAEHADMVGCQCLWQGRDFAYEVGTSTWQWRSESRTLHNLPSPSLPIQNASTALQVIQLLELNLNDEEIMQTLSQVSLPGRGQVIQTKPMVMLDVAHNPQATAYLARQIEAKDYDKLHLVVAMLADKDIESSLLPLTRMPASWYIAPLNVPRGAKTELLKAVLVGQQKVLDCKSVTRALTCAKQHAGENDLIVVFGSFFTVAEVLENETQ